MKQKNLKLRTIFIALLMIMQSMSADQPVVTKSVEIEVQRRKEIRSSTLGDTARIIAGIGCLSAAFLFYREARNHWVGLNDQDIKERAIVRLRNTDFFKSLAKKIYDNENNSEIANKKIDSLAGEKATTAKHLDIGENVVLALGFTYFGFNLLAQGLHIIK